MGTLTAVPSNLPANSGKTNPTALAAPVEVGIIEEDAALALLKSECKVSNTGWSPVNACTVVIKPLSIPTAPEIFSYNEYGILSRILISHDLKNDSQIGYNVGYNKYNNYDGDFIYTIAYGKSLGSFGVFFELFGNESSNSSNLNFDSGITYLIDDDKQLDLSIGRGLNSDMFYISAGFSIDIY